MANTAVQVEVPLVDDGDLPLLREACTQHGVALTRNRSIDPGSAVVLLGSMAMVVAAFSTWLERRQRSGERSWGQVIDLRPHAEQLVARDPSLEFGQILVVVPAADGSSVEVRIETYRPENDLVAVVGVVTEHLASALVRTAEEASAATIAVVGDKGAVSLPRSSEQP